MTPDPDFPHLAPVVEWVTVNAYGTPVTHRENVALGAALERVRRSGVTEYRPRSPRASTGLLGAVAGWLL